MQCYPGRDQIIQIDRDPTHIGRCEPVGMGLVGDVWLTIKALLPWLEQKDDCSHLEAARARWKDDLNGYDDEAEKSDPSLIHPQFVTRALAG